MGDETYEKGRDLAEQALGEYAAGHDEKGDALAEAANKASPEAAKDVVRDLDEDAAATGATGPA